jgi:hypothetical protein
VHRLVSPCQHQGPLRFGQLAIGAAIIAQGVRRWFQQGYLIGLIAELFEIPYQRLETGDVVPVRVEEPACSGIQDGRINRAVRSI